MDTSLINLATGLSQAKLANSVQTSVVRKTLDAEQAEGAAMVSLINAARGSSAAGVGGQIDVTA